MTKFISVVIALLIIAVFLIVKSKKEITVKDEPNKPKPNDLPKEELEKIVVEEPEEVHAEVQLDGPKPKKQPAKTRSRKKATKD